MTCYDIDMTPAKRALCVVPVACAVCVALSPAVYAGVSQAALSSHRPSATAPQHAATLPHVPHTHTSHAATHTHTREEWTQIQYVGLICMCIWCVNKCLNE